jgi:hypothetical protein
MNAPDWRRCSTATIDVGLRHQGEPVVLGVLAVALAAFAAGVLTVDDIGTWTVLGGILLYVGPSLCHVAWQGRAGVAITARALLAWPLLPTRMPGAGSGLRVALGENRILEDGPCVPCHVRLALASGLARRPWLRWIAGPDAVLGTDSDGTWIGRPRPDGGIEPIARRWRRPGRPA